MFALARDLGKDVREIESWPAGLMEEWAAFYSYEAKERAAAARKAKAEARSR